MNRRCREGDYVVFQSLTHSGRVWHGQVVGFCYGGEVAFCTDGTGLSPRPVAATRLQHDPHGASRRTLAALSSSE